MLEVQIRSVTSLNADTSLVRYSTFRTDPGGQRQAPQIWAAVIKYRFSGDAMSAEDRLLNPLGFQVVRYRRNEELAPAEIVQAPAPVGPQELAAPALRSPRPANGPISTRPVLVPQQVKP